LQVLKENVEIGEREAQLEQLVHLDGLVLGDKLANKEHEVRQEHQALKA